MTLEYKTLDHGYIRFVEDWGRGDAGEPEAGIIEAARQSTQGSFRGWVRLIKCTVCGKEWECENKPAVCNHGECNLKNSPTKEVHPGDQNLLRYLYSGKPQHATPFEFCGMVIEVQAPLMVFREWHRHRTQSYNEMSARYAPMPDMNYLPTPERCLMVSGTNKQAGSIKGSEAVDRVKADGWIRELQKKYIELETLYQWGLGLGIPKELARLCIPVGRYSRMRASANLRNWLAFMTLRSDPAAQWEIRQYSYALGDIIAQRFPRTWKLYIENGGAYRE